MEGSKEVNIVICICILEISQRLQQESGMGGVGRGGETSEGTLAIAEEGLDLGRGGAGDLLSLPCRILKAASQCTANVTSAG